MTACPCCFQDLPADVFRWQCQNEACQIPDPVIQSWLGPAAQSGIPYVWQRSPEQKKVDPAPTIPCKRCAGPASAACPNCHFLLPQNWRGAVTLTVAMAGARNTGKSVYIGVLVRFLSEYLTALNSNLSFADARSYQLYRESYEAALFAQVAVMGTSAQTGPRVMGPTPSAATGDSYQRIPIILDLGMISGRHVCLTLRDVAGEDLENHGIGARVNLTFFRHADLVVFLFDPLTIDSVAQTLVGIIPAQMQTGVVRPGSVLTTVLQLIGPSNPLLAVVLSKFDALQELRLIPSEPLGQVMGNIGAGMLRSPSLKDQFSPTDALLIHEEIRGLLQMLNTGELVSLVENPARGAAYRHRFMGVSSLGASVEGQSLPSHGIAPFRVLDPVLWLMAEHGVITKG